MAQNRQAVAVRDPVALAQLLELLIGTAGCAERLEALSARAQELARECEAAEDEADGCVRACSRGGAWAP